MLAIFVEDFLRNISFKFGENWPSGIRGVFMYSKLLTTHDAQGTTNTDRSHKLTSSAWCNGTM